MRLTNFALVAALVLSVALPSAHASTKMSKQKLARHITSTAPSQLPTKVTNNQTKWITTGQYLRVTDDCQIEVGKKVDMGFADAFWHSKETASLQMVRVGTLFKSESVWTAILFRPDRAEVVRGTQILANGSEKVRMSSQIEIFIAPGSPLLADLDAMADVCGAPKH